jgi:hypothetical protein
MQLQFKDRGLILSPPRYGGKNHKIICSSHYWHIKKNTMKRIKILSFLLLSLTAFFGCSKQGNYPGGRVSPYISIFDVKDLYKGQDLRLTAGNMYGSTEITAMVVSDHSGGNLPAGLLVVQESRRLSQLRGIAINIGPEAANYVPGDSVTIKIDGGVLKRVDGILQITGIPAGNVTKISSGNTIPVNRVRSSQIVSDPTRYENTLVVLVKAGFNPVAGPNDVLAGDKTLNDGFGDITLHTESTATFANDTPRFNANYYGIVFNSVAADKSLVPKLRVRTRDDIIVLSSSAEVQDIIITGFMPDVEGADGNYEYVQLMATRDINFATTPFSIVVTNNAGSATPTGAPANGWATGQQRTYKMNLTSGTAARGTFFYVGGSAKLINGVGSTNIASANWIRSFNYTTTAGDGFGTATSGLFANSGNASGVAVFAGTTVTATTKPIDVLFVGSSGSVYSAGPPEKGYLIANTDWYDVKNPITLADQQYFKKGTNTITMSYLTSDAGKFNVMGGEYNVTMGRWMKARAQNPVDLSKTSTLSEIEGDGATKLLH